MQTKTWSNAITF